jgi:squalene-hopene/tetraprenyl-beta-curcumene cyclase
MKTIAQSLLLAPILASAFLIACGDEKPEAGGGKSAARNPPAADSAGGEKPMPKETLKPEDAGPATSAPAAGSDVDAAIEKGAAWLRAQAKDGVWQSKGRDGAMTPNAAYTALSLAAVAGALPPEKRLSDPLCKSAADFLVSKIGENGAVESQQYLDNYFTSAALMALATINDPRHKAAREKMKGYVLSIQQKEEGRIFGGFGYNDHEGADLSNAQFAIQALRDAGLPEDHEAMVRARTFLEHMQNRSENEANDGAAWEMKEGDEMVTVVPGDDGSASYEPGSSKAGLERLPDGTFVARGYGSMTYALLKCYLLTGVEVEDARVQAALDWLGKNYTWDENPGFRPYVRETKKEEAPYWGVFYYYMTAAKALRVAGIDKLKTPDGPKDWRKDLAAAVIRLQRDDGSWLNDKAPRWQEGDPLIATGYALNALEDIKAASSKQ